jgi:DnaJ-domain-containing protein 1
VTDYFRLLNEPRRPGLNTALLRQKFLALAAEFHPDRVHQASEAEKAAANRHYAAQEWIAQLNSWQKKLGEMREQLNTRLESLDHQWARDGADDAKKPAILARLEELYRFYGYFNRWQNQLQERVARLSF